MSEVFLLQQKFISDKTISEIVNSSDTGAYEDIIKDNSTEILSDSSGGEEEFIVQSEQIRTCERMCVYTSKQQITDTQLR